MKKPSQILFEDIAAPALIPCCDHYAGNIRFISKALELQRTSSSIFDITCDLEDGAEVGHETELRSNMIELLNSSENSKRRAGIRVHDPEHQLFLQDIEQAISQAGNVISHLTIPKIKSFKAADKTAHLIRSATSEAGIRRTIPLHFLIETHQALHEVWEIAQIPSVQSLEFGIMDFISSHHGTIPSSAMRSPEQFEHALLVRAKSMIASAAAAFGKTATHNVTIEYKNLALVRSDARTASRRLGYRRMWSIHPDQIQEICQAMAPDESEIELAAKVLTEGQQNGWGPLAIEGTLYDRASYRYYLSILKQASLFHCDQKAKRSLEDLGELPSREEANGK